MQLFLGILLLIMAIFLIISVLMQSGKSKRLSGTIAGGAETFFGKSKGRSIDSVLSKLTTIVAILFVLVVIIVYVAFGTTYTEPEINYQPIVGADETAPAGDDATTETPDDATDESTEATGDATEETTEEPTEATEGTTEATEESTETPTEE